MLIGIIIRKHLYKLLTTAFKPTLKKKPRIIKNEYIPNGKPTIFSSTHVFYDDVAAVLCCLPCNAYVLSGGKNYLQNTSDGLGLSLNGVIWVDRGNKKSRADALNKIKKILSYRGNVLMFPEAAWNFSPNLLVQKLYWGILEAAQATGANIAPVVIHETDNEYVVHIGKIFDFISINDKAVTISSLRDEMATMVWDLIAESIVKREEISHESWRDYIYHKNRRRMFDYEKEEKYLLQSKEESQTLGELLADLHGIKYKSMATDWNTYMNINRLIDNWNKPVKIQ